MVGGIYTVLSSRAKTLQEHFHDRIVFIGPDIWTDKECPYFREDAGLMAQWQWEAKEQGLRVRMGRWTIPGEPIAVLVDFRPYYEKKNEIYTWLWEHYQVDSLHAYGDYDEASMFSYAAALVVESMYHGFENASDLKVVYHANEWMCGLGALYLNDHVPQIGTVFTTHATTVGRSIAGNQKPLYDYLYAYNGDQMAWELNVQSKHSIEKQTAHHVDCFTTVSDITAHECLELLDKKPDVVLPNGFDDSFVPRGAAFTRKRKAARQKMLQVASALMGETLDDDTLIVSTSGRYEFRNKGIDVFVEAMNRLLRDRDLKKKVLAFIDVPGWVGEPRKDLQERLTIDHSPLTNDHSSLTNDHSPLTIDHSSLTIDHSSLTIDHLAAQKTVEDNNGQCSMVNGQYSIFNGQCSMVNGQWTTPLEVPMITHWLHNMGHDNVLNMMKFYDMHNRPEDAVKVVFLPCYLDGHDGILNLTYYDVVLGNDLCIYPSYYEPWGYTPLEAVAFRVPCITTDLAGFGLWVDKELGHHGELEDGVKVIHRTDYNYSEVADAIKDTVARYSSMKPRNAEVCRKAAEAISKKALWCEFIRYYYQAYDIALQRAEQRMQKTNSEEL